jgi:endonuclease YncB( thermonuclease family)
VHAPLAAALVADLGHIAAAPGRTIVVDGDTLRMQNDVVRLDGVAAPARGDSCDQASRADCAAAAAAQLALLVRDHPVSCRVVGHDPLGRPSARCDVGSPTAGPEPADSLNQQIVASGWARAQAADLRPAELAARASHRGLWASDRVPGGSASLP